MFSIARFGNLPFFSLLACCLGIMTPGAPGQYAAEVKMTFSQIEWIAPMIVPVVGKPAAKFARDVLEAGVAEQLGKTGDFWGFAIGDSAAQMDGAQWTVSGEDPSVGLMGGLGLGGIQGYLRLQAAAPALAPAAAAKKAAKTDAEMAGVVMLWEMPTEDLTGPVMGMAQCAVVDVRALKSLGCPVAKNADATAVERLFRNLMGRYTLEEITAIAAGYALGLGEIEVESDTGLVVEEM